jgi:hypothetical protein
MLSGAERRSLVDDLREGREAVGEPPLDDAALAAELERAPAEAPAAPAPIRRRPRVPRQPGRAGRTDTSQTEVPWT